MSFYDSSDALYGTGRHGAARYGKVAPNVSLTGVGATGAIETVSVGGFEIDISENLLSVSATGSIGSLGVGVSETLTGVSATGSINTVKENVAEELGSVTATGAVGTIEPQVDEDLNSVSATGAIGTLKVNVSETLASVSATGAIATVEAKTSESLLSVTATFTIGTIKPNVSETVTAVVGTVGAPSVTARSSSKAGIVGLELTGSIAEPEATVDEALQSVAATISLGSINVGIIEKLSSVSSSAVINLPVSNVSSIQFDYEAVKHRYNKRRTVLLPRAA